MKHTQSMTRNSDFHRLYTRGKSLVDRNFVIYYRKSRRDLNLLGITVGKKIGCAVMRNRAKRLIRESYRLLEPRIMEGYDFVVVARGRTPHMQSPVIMEAMERQLESAGLLLPGPEGNKERTSSKKEQKKPAAGRTESAVKPGSANGGGQREDAK
ncbi:Ribonuclease P protein component [bioreactor metagenome]|uniref:Ribonuclease P protein component n=1 Tax=bioreactor metagenome TaxID=1076179 RepID=A0A645DWP7_9ZZZZ